MQTTSDEPSKNIVDPVSRHIDITIDINSTGKIVSTCSNFESLGYSLEDVAEKEFDFLIDWNRLGNPANPKVLQMLLESSILTLPLRSKKIENAWYEVNLSPENTSEEKHTLFLRDITNLRLLEKELVNNTLLWNMALEAFDDPLYILDLDEKVVRANQAFYTLKGLTSEQVIGTKITDIMHPDGEETPCPVCVARAERRDAYITLEADHPKNGAGRPIEIMVRNIKNDQGDPIGTLMGTRDLTRIRQTEDELLRLNNHISLLMESTGEGIFGVDTQLKCTFVNRAAAKMLKYTQDEMIGKDMTKLILHTLEDGTPYPLDQTAIYRCIQKGISYWADDEVMWEKDNTSFPVQYRVNPILVGGNVNGAVVVFRNVAKSRAMVKQMTYLARHDYLTGLFNRLEFEERLVELVEDANISGHSHVLCYMDLDQFKIVNDTCGHIAGDQLLKQLSQLLKKTIRDSDTIARLGGDEFGLLLRNCEIEQAIELVNKILQRVSEFRFPYEDKLFSIGVSIGVVQIDSESDSLAHTLAAADSACYLAKEDGRNRFHLYQANEKALVNRHREIQWVSRLKTALEEKRIKLYGQKIMPCAINSDAKFAVEILMRIEDDDNLITPGSFISAAERYDLMPTLDRVVINYVFNWLEKHSNHPKMSAIDFFTINISGLSVSQPDFLDFLKERITHSSLSSDMICFELTETAAVSNLDSAKHFMSELKSLGCRFALDDFGSGMSSFAYLKNLPVDFLKIDGHFIKDIVNDPVDNAMVMAVNQVGHVMGLKTIAEFVEDDEVQSALQKIGVDYVQGYNVGHPVPIDECFRKQ